MSFTHHQDGTPEEAWQPAITARLPATLELDAAFFAGVEHLLVLAAHPDDETLGAAGLLARAYASGVRTSVLVATSGEASHPESSTHSPTRLAALREAETAAAVALASPGADLHFVRLPDGGLSDAHAGAALAEALDRLLAPPDAAVSPSSAADGARADGGAASTPPADIAGIAATSPAVIVAPWGGDRHPDHVAAADAAAEAARRWGARLLAYPIWLWHWGDPDGTDVPWERLRALPLGESERAAKAEALRVHRSQVEPLGPGTGDEVLLHAGMLRHFERDVELFIEVHPDAPGAPHSAAAAPVGASTTSTTSTTATAEAPGSAAAAEFDRLNDGPDPWGFESRWYEERKRAVLLAALPQRSFGRVLEVGCSTGVLSQALIERTTAAFRGIDVSARALERARERNSGSAIASFERVFVPEEWPTGAFDLVVLSEIGYYLDEHELARLVDRVIATAPTEPTATASPASPTATTATTATTSPATPTASATTTAPATATPTPTPPSVDEPPTPTLTVVCCHWRHPVEDRPFSGDHVHDAFRVRPELELVAHHLEEDFVLDVFEHPSPGSIARREGIL